MRKLLFILLPTILLPTLTVTSCSSWFKLPRKTPTSYTKNPDYKDNLNKDDKKEIIKNFSYNGITYNLNQEDNINPENVYFANEVLENDAKQFKSYIPDYKKYFYNQVNNALKLDTPDLGAPWFDFPTIAKLSQFVRSLEHYNVVNSYNSSFMLKDKTTKQQLTSEEYNNLVNKILEILKNQNNLIKTINDEEVDFSSINNSKNEKVSDQLPSTLEHRKQEMGFNDTSSNRNYWGTYTETKLESGAIKKEYSETPLKDSQATAFLDGSLKQIPVYLWKLKKIFDFNGNFKNEYFLQREFFEKSSEFNREKQDLNNEISDYFYRNKIKIYAMQKDLWNMLIAYLEFQKAMTTLGNVSDENLSLEDNFRNSKILEAIGNFQNKLLEYMKLSQLFGWLIDPSKEDLNLQLFPGGTHYSFETDYRQAYIWAYREYHEIIQPLSREFTRTNVESTFNNTFKNPELEKYYDFIWANIKAIDNVDKPYVLGESEAKTKFNKIIDYYARTFNWKYKKGE
ncbi:lipoprotein [Mycoplasma mycoides subsp. capri]|uniref:MAG3960 family lipoprotein n=1 Tax=Mycoplasma mycoides TaxID=2102 RepID=UPI00224070A1|nr:lipoprotein [Mycoplasma mycoides]UZK63968.1 lipoprotein [Mycoplasma mycoides subsp. capri]